ncbi:MAG: helicase [Anaerolineae bacterium]|nr:MAG: helicase [Anaerolineae bacterium]
MNLVFFDLETQNLFQEVGGRGNIARLRLACAVTYSTARGDFAVYWERDAQALIAELKSADRVIGYNLFDFDYQVLKPYAPFERLDALPTLDMLQDLYHHLGFRPGLDAVAAATLGVSKTADGVQSVKWFRRGELEKVAEYCKADVEITRRLFEFGREHGFVYYITRRGGKAKVAVDWRL